MTTKFKTGDKVRRIKCNWKHFNNMCVGDISIVKKVNPSGSLNFEKYGVGHDNFMFELVSKVIIVDFNNTKVRVRNSEESTKVQKAMFKRGFHWGIKSKEVDLTNQPFLYFKDNYITYSVSGDRGQFFKKQSNKEITVKEILRKSYQLRIKDNEFSKWQAIVN